MHERGESSSSPSSGPPLSNSTSHSRFTAFLVRFAGGGEAEGESTAEGVGVVGCSGGAGAGDAGGGGGARFLERRLLGVSLAAGSGKLGFTASGAVTSRRRRWRRRRRFAAGATTATEDGESEQERVTS